MQKRLEHFLAGVLIFAIIAGIYADKIFGKGYIFTEIVQDITNLYGFYPWDHFSAGELRQGYFPLWNSHNGLGVPHMANMQSAIFFPLNWPKFFLGYEQIIDWILIGRLWIAGFFLYLFLRRAARLGAAPALLAGISFALCGYFLRFVYMSHLNVECLLPLQLLTFHYLAEKRKIAGWLLSGAGIYLLVAGGFPEASLYAIAFSSIYFLFGTKNGTALAEKLALLFSALAFGILLASVQWLSFTEYLGQAWTYHQSGSGMRHHDFAYAISMLLPWFFGKNLESTLVPFLTPGLGTVAVIFAGRAMFGARSDISRTGFWLIGVIFLLGLIFGLPPFIWLGHLFPFSLTYNDKYALPVLALCVSVLAGIGLERTLRDERPRPLLAVLGLAWIWASLNLAIALMNGFQPFYGLGVKLELGRLVAVSALLLLAMSLLGSKMLRNAFTTLVLLAAVGSLYFDYRCNRGIELSDYLQDQLQEAKHLAKVFPEPYRYSAEGDILFPDLLLPLGVDDLRSYNPLYPKSYVYFMAAINGLKTGEEISRHYDKHKLFQIDRGGLNSALVPLANLKLYSADYELNSLPLTETILKDGKETGRFAGWARQGAVEIQEINKKSLLMPAPGKIDVELATAPPPVDLYFYAGVAPANGAEQGSGQFQILLEQGGAARLAYARYLNPAQRLEERQWSRAQVAVANPASKLKFSLVGLSGPNGEGAGSNLAWGGIRFRMPKMRALHTENWTEKGEISLNYLASNYSRYFLVPGVGVIPAHNLDEEFAQFGPLASVQAGYFRNQAVVGEQMKLERTGKRLEGQSWVKVSVISPEEIDLNLKAVSDCFLVASDQYYPGWRAILDHKEVRIHRADLALRTLFIPAGEHAVQFRYEPASFAAGLWTSLAGLLSALFLVGAALRASGPVVK